MALNPNASSSSQPAVKEFTESWIQALTLSVESQAARRIRPWMTDIDAISAVKLNEGHLDAAKRVWDFCQLNGLAPLLQFIPANRTGWKFDEDECFVFEPIYTEDAKTLETWSARLGLVAGDTKLSGRVTYEDWTNLIRKEAVRKGKPLNISAIPDGGMYTAASTGHWDLTDWTTNFETPNWLSIKQTGPFTTKRPEMSEIEEALMVAIDHANTKMQPANGAKISITPSKIAWIYNIERLQELHEHIVGDNKYDVSAWFKRVWCAVWPVVYRERNRLRGASDLQWIRTELADCFKTVPEMTEWMFVFARLTCQMQVGNGLGIAGDFVDA